MTPTPFGAANIIMRKPPDMTEEECQDVHAYSDGRCVVTCWEPTAQERVRIAAGAPIYLMLLGRTMQPALLMLDPPYEPRCLICGHSLLEDGRCSNGC